MIVLLDTITTHAGIVERARYLKRENATDLFGNFESFFQFAKNSKSLRRRKNKLFTVTISLSPSDKVNEELLKEIVLTWIKGFWAGYPLEEIPFCAVWHRDTENPHIHLTVANTNLANGKHLQWYYHYSPDFPFVNQLNRYIEERFGLKRAFEEIKPLSTPKLFLSKKKKGKTTPDEETLLEVIEELNREILSGKVGSLNDLKNRLEELLKKRTIDGYKIFTPKGGAFGALTLRKGKKAVKIWGIGLTEEFYRSKISSKDFTFDRQRFFKYFRYRFGKLRKKRGNDTYPKVSLVRKPLKPLMQRERTFFPTDSGPSL